MNSTIIQQIGAAISIGGIIFKIGQQSERLEIIGLKVEAQESKVELENAHIYDIKNDITSLKSDVSYIKNDIHDIKSKLNS
tara:strand:+ start:1581 stop:1823 length:243 start_codon:yes stop_codon:yes gene_type:complete